MKKILHIILSLSLVSCISPNQAANKSKIVEEMANTIQKKFPSVQNISVTESLKNPKYSDSIFLDVRSENEQKVSVIPGSISMDQFNKNPELYKNKKVIVYCTIGYRSSEKVIELSKKGVEAYNLKAGILAWAEEGLLFEKDGIETKKVHVYAEAWNFLPQDYEGVY